ncbi:hypothetical protein ACH4D4_30295 [Streptomyces pristinaespiralis]|uniref:hypothetical protein n=1 Tax=Streptomyces pristinaespiralis TaxID=38300 RepID=UPI0037882ABF
MVLRDGKKARDDTERKTTADELVKEFASLHELFGDFPDGSASSEQRTAERHWDKRWQEQLRPTRAAVQRVRDALPREFVLTGLEYVGDSRVLDNATQGEHWRREYLLRNMVEYLESCVYAWRRGEARLPEPTAAFRRLKGAWELTQELAAEDAQALEEWQAQERQRRSEERRRSEEE